MLDVLYDTTLVGQLWSEQRVLCFQYAPDWRDSPASFPLCPSLPMQEEPFTSDAPALSPMPDTRLLSIHPLS